MPMLVAQRAAPRKACTWAPAVGTSHMPTNQPRPNGATTPSTATSRADVASRSICGTVDSRPTANNRSNTPRLASSPTVGSVLSGTNTSKPSAPTLPSRMPPTSSPSTAGCPRRVAISPPILAVISSTASDSTSGATGSPCPEAGCDDASPAVSRTSAAPTALTWMADRIVTTVGTNLWLDPDRNQRKSDSMTTGC